MGGWGPGWPGSGGWGQGLGVRGPGGMGSGGPEGQGERGLGARGPETQGPVLPQHLWPGRYDPSSPGRYPAFPDSQELHYRILAWLVGLGVGVQ